MCIDFGNKQQEEQEDFGLMLEVAVVELAEEFEVDAIAG